MGMLRPHQDGCLDAIAAGYEAGLRRVLAVLCTGAGKTVIFSNLMKKLGYKGQTLVLAHRDELIQQAADKMRYWNPDLRVGIEMGEQYASPLDDVIIASVATLGRKDSKRIHRFDWEDIRLVICDEAHHSTASTYMNIFEHAGLFEPDTDKLLVGVTATPNRGDGEALAKVYEKIVYTYSIRQAIEDGWLSDVKGIKLRTDTNLDEVRTQAGDFQTGELSQTVNNPRRNQQIVKAWVEHGYPRQTVVFCVDIQHAKDMALVFQKSGVPAEAIWGDDPKRAEKLKAHREGKLQVITNCGILTEGYDDWRIGCIILARPTKSQSLFVQMAGRGTRLQEGIGNLKEALAKNVAVEKRDCLMIDVVDNSDRHSLVTVPTLLGLNAKLDLKGKSIVAAAKTLEEAQTQNPSIDFSKLEDIDQIKAHVESVNLWDIKFPEEVEQNSELSWHKAVDGAFVLLLPEKEQIRIKQNLLDKWEIHAVIKAKKYKGERTCMEDAFKAADELIRKVAPDALKVLEREADWHSGPASDPQRRALKYFLGKNHYMQLPADLTSGQASKIISMKIAQRMQGKGAARRWSKR